MKNYATKNLFHEKIFSYNDFNLKNFINFIMESFYTNDSYTILIKFGFNGNSYFYMSGRQIGLRLQNYHNLDYYNSIYNIY